MDDLTKNRGILKLHESFATEEEYRASNCLSYSILKEVHDNPEILLKEKVEVDKEYFTFGKLVDMMLTNPKEIENTFFVNDKVPSDQYKAIIQYYVNNQYSTKLEDLTNEDIEILYSKSGSDSKWLPDTKRKKLIENGSDYLVLLTEHKDKTIVSTEIFMEATKVSEMLRTHPWTKEYFLSEKEQLENNIEILYQFKIKYGYEGCVCKSMLDIVVIDHDLKVITPIDIKTGTDSHRFFIKHALCKYKYGYQGVLYSEGLTRFILKIEELKDYVVDDFKFIYVCRFKPTFPIILNMTDRCHSEFKDLGIDTTTYDIPPLIMVLGEVEYYMNSINEGKTTLIPYDIERRHGIIQIDSFDKNVLTF
jgi:hypothetical protein